jgi:hypothetical protein
MKSTKYLIVALLSISIIGLELVWTRIFSAEFFYTFSFLILSLAIMGLGLGALALRMLKFLNRDSVLGISLSLAGLMTLIGPPLVFKLGLDFSGLLSNWTLFGKLIITIILLSSSYFFGGIALATLFKHNYEDMPRLYMFDLIGAGIGVLLAVVLMNALGTQTATFYCAIPVLLAALIVCRPWLKILPIGFIVLMIFLSTSAANMLEVQREERAPVIYKNWDALSKVKVFDYGTGYRGINIDNIANSPVYEFGGDTDSLQFEYGIDCGYLIEMFDSCTFLSLGSGGGVDVMQALQYGATEVHAVEVNGHINHMMTKGNPSGYIIPDDTTEYATMADYTGQIYDDPRVKVVTEDARAYVRRYKNKFDMIYSLSSNSWAALGSGAFALAENYLFTTEAFKDYWESLTDSGFMMMEHQFYMSRIVSEVTDALTQLGVDDIHSHFAVYNFAHLRRKILLISKRPLTDTILAHAVFELDPEFEEMVHLLFPANDTMQDNVYNKIIMNGWESEQDSAGINISPCTDDRPFIAQMGLWKNVKKENIEKLRPYELLGFPLSKIIILIILAVIIVIIIPLNLLPYLKKGEKLKFIPWMYFFTIGMAFMIVEIILIQKYTLFIGPSVYSIIAILLTLLVASGIGSRFTKKVHHKLAFAGIVGWLLIEIFLFGKLTYALGGLTMLPRILVTIVLIFPLGFFMGMPFPKGTLRVGELIDWGFAVNGAASVLGSTVIMLVAFTYGFTMALLLGLLLYLLAYLLISSRNGWNINPTQ